MWHLNIHRPLYVQLSQFGITKVHCRLYNAPARRKVMLCLTQAQRVAVLDCPGNIFKIGDSCMRVYIIWVMCYMPLYLQIRLWGSPIHIPYTILGMHILCFLLYRVFV